MTNEIIPMAALPCLTDNIKQAIGLSIWSLFQIESDIDDAKYLLKTNDKSFLLKEDGSVINEAGVNDNIIEKAQVQFEGYVIPSGVKLNSIYNTI